MCIMLTYLARIWALSRVMTKLFVKRLLTSLVSSIGTVKGLKEHLSVYRPYTATRVGNCFSNISGASGLNTSYLFSPGI